jgi:hypothetical protein
MRTAAANIEAEQRRLWAQYAERLRGLEGAEYDRVEAEAWEELRRALDGLGIPAAAADPRAL